MSTRSGIAVAHGDKIKAIYCHSDGYIEYNGVILYNHYDSVKANALVAQGDCSFLGKEIGEKIEFNFQTDYDEDGYAVQCRFYGRDRGETGVDYKVFHSEQEFVDGIDGEYFYLFKNGAWYVSQGKEFRLLKDRIQEVLVERLSEVA